MKRSSTVGTPSRRTPPDAFGISTRRTGLRRVAAGEKPGPDLGPVGLQVIAQLVDGHAVDAGRPLIAPDTRQRLLQIAGLDDRLHRRLLPSRRAFGLGTRRAGFGPLGSGAPGFTLRRRLQGQLQLVVLPPGPHERCRPTDPCPSFGPSPASRLLCPLLTSAPRSRALRTRSVRDFRTRRRPPEVRPTAFAASPPDLPSRPLMAVDFAITRSLVPAG